MTAKEIEAAVRHALALEANPVHPVVRTKRRCFTASTYYFFQIDSTLERYPHHFGNYEGTNVFPNQEDERGGLREAVFVRGPKGDPLLTSNTDPSESMVDLSIG